MCRAHSPKGNIKRLETEVNLMNGAEGYLVITRLVLNDSFESVL